MKRAVKTVTIICLLLSLLGIVVVFAYHSIVKKTLKEGKIPSEISDAIEENQELKELGFWTSDTIYYTNPQLVTLLDTLYRYVREDSFTTKSTEERFKWMKNYQQQLCLFYDRNKLGNNRISTYAKTDTIFHHAERLWNVDRDYSTMGMTIHNSTINTWIVFKQYETLIHLWDLCNNEKQRHKLLKEWEAWERLKECFTDFWIKCVDIAYWGGSGAGPHQTSGHNNIIEAHLNMNQTEIHWLDNTIEEENIVRNGVLLNPAKELFFNCCQSIFEEIALLEEINNSDIYKPIYDEALKQKKNLRVLVDTWLQARDEWEQEVSSDYIHSYYKRNSSMVLLSLAQVISSLE